ncbi:MAG: hypothetical protein QOJ59_4816 [Thermomicrobiales bacterium]|jgi:uncharacterized protein (DUF2267 family)|nr:hypothetical protein [Thermomicrobiales bacterium]
MASTGLDVFDATVQKTNTWLKEIAEELYWDDRHRAYLALRGTLHALRDYLVPDEAAHLAAQLPLLVRGMYYEGWDPSRTPTTERSREDFLGRIAAEFARADPSVNPARVAGAVLRVLSEHIAGGELDDVRQSLPKDVREVWPQAA